MLNVERNKFLFVVNVVVVDATKGSLLEEACVITPVPTNNDESQRARKSETKTSFKALSCSFLLFVSLFLARIGRKVKDS